MIRFGDSPETLRSLETVAQDERDYAAIRTISIVRIFYLCVLAAYMLHVMTFFFIKIAPEFEKIFKDFDMSMPAMTIGVLAVSKWFVYYWFLTVPLMMLLVLAAFAFLILQTNVVVFRPIGFRRIFRSMDAAKFLRVCAVGVRHRFSIPAILEKYCWMVPSKYLRQKGLQMQKTVEQGCDWIDAVCSVGFVNRPEASLLKSAERTGNIAAVLDQLAQSKERSQIRKDDLFSKLAFIPLIFLLGGIIGTFVIAMFIPLLKMITTLSAIT
jgi:type II secretory pathway component PulF